TGCILVDYSFLPGFVLTAEFNDSKYAGFGIGPGISYYPLKEPKFKPHIYLSYLRTLGARFSYDRDNDVITSFKTTDANYIIPMIGLRYDDKGGDPHFKNYFSYILRVGYKAIVSDKPLVLLTNGPPYEERQTKIERYRDNGLVASLSLVFNFAKK